MSRETEILYKGSRVTGKHDTPECEPIYLTNAFNVSDLDELDFVYDGGGYAYIFFERERDLKTGSYTTEDMTDVYATGCIYAEKRLDKADFNDVRTGDSIERVISIDHAAFITKQWADWNEALSEERTNLLISKHLLTDGLLAITYEYNGDELVVRDMEFSSDFVFISPYLSQENIEYPKLFKILPQDYPPEA